MLNPNLEKALNAQINAEMWSAYLYLSMATYFHSIGHAGIAHWFEIQFKEEQDHALILYNFLVSRGGRVKLDPIKSVQTEWETPLAAFEDTLKHERSVTQMINDLYALAIKENDYTVQNRLRWFIDEQIEEEDEAQKIIDSLRLIDGNGLGLYMFDKELGARTYTTPTPLNSAAE